MLRDWFQLDAYWWAPSVPWVVTVDYSDNFSHVLVLEYCSPLNSGSNDVLHDMLQQMNRIVTLLDTRFVTIVNMDDPSPKVATNCSTKLKGESFDVPHAQV